VRTVFTKSLGSASANSIATSQSGTIGTALTLNGSAVTAGVATIDTASATNSAIGRRVLITTTSADATNGVVWVVVGTNAYGATITDSFNGVNAGTVNSNLDFVTVTSITPTAGSAGTTATQVGTSQIGSSPWLSLNWRGFSPLNVGVAVELVSGSATYQVEYTYDDPNQLLGGAVFPLPFTNLTPAALKGPASATGDGAFTTPIVAVRLTTETGTGVLRCRIVEAGTG
jgi:hypothetical protein